MADILKFTIHLKNGTVLSMQNKIQTDVETAIDNFEKSLEGGLKWLRGKNWIIPTDHIALINMDQDSELWNKMEEEDASSKKEKVQEKVHQKKE